MFSVNPLVGTNRIVEILTLYSLLLENVEVARKREGSHRKERGIQANVSE
jgi:hypothetical protein